MLDLKTNQWEQLNYKGCPSPRSGHRMVRFYVLCLPEYSLQAPNMIFFSYMVICKECRHYIADMNHFHSLKLLIL